MSCCHHPEPSLFWPAWSILNQLAFVASYLSHVVPSHSAMYVMSGPVLCGHYPAIAINEH